MKKIFSLLALFAVTAAFAAPIKATPYPAKHWRLSTSNGYAKRLARTKNTTVLFIGDSITHGWTMSWVKVNGLKYWNTDFKKYAKVNIGISGDKVENVLWRITEGKHLDLCKASVIVLMIGANNLGINTPQEIANGIQDILKIIKTKQPQAKVLLLGLMPVAWRMKEYAQVNALICKFGDNKTVYYLDLSPDFLNADPKKKTKNLRDGIHPTEEGYRLMAKRIASAIDKILAEKKK